MDQESLAIHKDQKCKMKKKQKNLTLKKSPKKIEIEIFLGNSRINNKLIKIKKKKVKTWKMQPKNIAMMEKTKNKMK